MTNDGCEFLVGADLSERIRAVCGSSEADCAVAFWGINMRDILFPQWGDGSGFRIVCDISQGATCRAALRQLGAPKNSNLRVAHGFHGKVYISKLGAVVGSPNASKNGVGRVAEEGGVLLEAGVFCPPGSDGYASAVQWFNMLFMKSRMVDPQILLSAPERSGELTPRSSGETPAGLSLLDRLRDYPHKFHDVRIAIATGHIDEHMAKASKKERARARDSTALAIDDVVLQKDADGVLPSFVGPLILLWRLRTVTQVFAYLNCSTWPPSQPDTVFGVDDWPGFWAAIGEEPSEHRLSTKESQQIGRLLAVEDGAWMFSANEFSEALLSLPNES